MPAPAAVAAAVAPAVKTGLLKTILSSFGTPTGLGLSSLAGLGVSGYFMAGGGQPSEEDQERMLRRQLEIQDEFERKRAGQMGGDDMQDLVGGGGGQRDLLGLMMEEERTRKLADISRSLERASMQPRMSTQLESLLAGEHARLAQMQSQRTLSPLELIQFAESM